MKNKFMKNGVFSLEYDKETLRDIVLELQEENKKQKEVIDKAIEFTNKNWGTWCTHHLEYMTEIAAGLRQPWEYRVKFFGEDEETAKKW